MRLDLLQLRLAVPLDVGEIVHDFVQPSLDDLRRRRRADAGKQLEGLS